MEEYKEIIASDLPETEKLARAFGWVTGRFIEYAQNEIELSRALNDQEAVVKEQIKMEVMKHARSIFQDCYSQVSGVRRRFWDE